MMQLEYLKTTREVAKMMGCSVRNISKLVEAEKLKPIKILENGSFLFNTKDVEFFINQKTEKK
jgi:excisionase family DNA binding protein